jgi:PAS domain S-box-containing protein
MATNASLFSGSGEVRALLLEVDWIDFPLGLPNKWPGLLKTMMGMVLDSSLPMYMVWGPELHFFYNDAYIEVLGKKHPQALGRPLWQVWPELESDFRQTIDAALLGTPAFFKETEMVLQRHGFDETTWFNVSISPIRQEDGTVPGLWVTVVETTQQVLAQRQRIAELDLLRNLFREAPGFMAIVRGPQHVFEIANQAYIDATGGRELLHKPIREALPELEGQGYYELLDQVYSTGEPYVAHGLPVKLKRGPEALEELLIDFVYQPIAGADDVVSGIFIQGSDVTEQYHAQQALEKKVQELNQADRRKDEFLAMLAHELRNPLAPIRAAAELLQMVKLDENRVHQTSQIISRQVYHITGLVDDLLDVSRVTRGLIELDVTPLDISQIIADAIEQSTPLIRSRRHHLGMQLAADVGLVLGDKKRLVQVVTNLLGNAAKYMHNGGHILIRTEVRNADVLIQVSDEGIGMAPDLVERAFDLFAQAERTSDRSAGGLGLGLALVKSLIGLHHGTVTCESAGLGQGSTFTVCLPRLLANESVNGSQYPSSTLQRSANPLRIMVVDDNIDAAAMLAMLLEASGHQVIVEYGARRALERSKTEPPHVFLLDIGLPEIDGNELAQRLRAQPETAKSVLVAVTGYGQDSDRGRTLAAGFDHHLVKPVDIRKLTSILAELNKV